METVRIIRPFACIRNLIYGMAFLVTVVSLSRTRSIRPKALLQLNELSSEHSTEESLPSKSRRLKPTPYWVTVLWCPSIVGPWTLCKWKYHVMIYVHVINMTNDYRHPMGHFVKTLGSSGDKETETEVLLLEHDVPYQEFSKRVLDDLPAEGDDWVVTEKHLTTENRRDLRHLNICSIDPPGKLCCGVVIQIYASGMLTRIGFFPSFFPPCQGCTDIDDALHVRPLENGNYEIGVRKCDFRFYLFAA